MGNPSPVSANEEQLSKVLTGNRLFEVPRFQRGYSWRDDELEDFWRDLTSVYKDQSRVHFLGAMVFTHSSTPYLYVLDGQQRLITLLLLVAAMRSVLKDNTEQSDFALMLSQAITPTMLINNQTQQRTRIYPGEIDRKAFEDLVKHGSLTENTKHDSCKLMKRAYEYFYKQLLCVLDSDGVEALQALYQTICDRVWYIEIICGDQINPQLVFESLNAKGEELSVADLIKNYLFFRIEQARGAKAVDDAEKSWMRMVDNLGRDSLVPDYIHAYWNSRFGYSRKENIYAELKAKDRSGSSSAFDPYNFLEDLQSEAQTYAEIGNPSEGFWDSQETVRNLRDLRTLNVRIIYSILLALWSQLQDNSKEFREMTRAIRNFMLRYRVVAGKSSNIVDSRFSELARQIRQGQKGPQDVLEFLRETSPTREEFLASFKTLRVSSGPAARLLLADINNALNHYLHGGDSNAMVVDPERVTLEHVIPQKPSSEWQRYLSSKGLDAVDVNLLGNLTLLTSPWNTSASNHSFDHKRDNFYAQSALPINRSLVFRTVRDPQTGEILLNQEGPMLTEWGLEEMRDRQELLGLVAEQIWSV